MNRETPASAKDLQPNSPTPTAAAASTALVVPASHRHSSAPGQKLLLQLPSGQPGSGSSPTSNKSRGSTPISPNTPRLLAIPHSRKVSCASPRSPRSGGLETWDRGGKSWEDLHLTVKLRDIRLVEEGLDGCYELETEVEGSLRRARHRHTLKQCWVRTTARRTDKSDSEKKQFLGKLRTLDHPNVLKVLDLVRSHSHYALIYEATEGGSALSLLQTPSQRGKIRGIKEELAAEVMRQVFAGLSYCQTHLLPCKYLSLQSILFQATPSDKGLQVKLLVPLGESGDAGVQYIAPEVLNKSYFGPANDLYSCGVILSNLLINDSIRCPEDVLTLPSRKSWEALSPEARSLLAILLCRDYEGRGTVEDCRQHPWVVRPVPKPALSPCLRSALRNMATARPLTSLRKTLFQLVFNLVLSAKDLKEATKAFKELDTDSDGVVSEEELRIQLYRLFPEEQAQAALTAITSLAQFTEGKLAYSEFLLWAISHQIICAPTNLISAFRLLDGDMDRKVTGKELREMISIEPDDNNKDSYTWRLLVFDISGSPEGNFSYAQFARFLTEG